MKSFYVCPNEENPSYLPSCFVCGFKKSGAYTISLRQNGQPGPYFPFLETHDPPHGAKQPTNDGKVLSCYMCYAFLYQQWESYERDKVPPVKRIYWLKRVDGGPYTGVELGMQSEYASQVFGLTSDQCQSDSQKNFDIRSRYGSISPKELQPSSLNKIEPDTSSLEHSQPAINSHQDIETPEQHEALDLSVEKRGIKRDLAESATYDDSQVLDLSLPDQESGTEACYICGIQVNAKTLHAIYAVYTPPYICGPHFQNIQFHPRAGGSVPIKRNGTISACLCCTSRLFALWNIYQKHDVPHNKRNYFFKIPCSDFEELKCCKCLKPLESKYRPQLDHSVKMGPNPLENALIVELSFMCITCHESSLEVIGWKKTSSPQTSLDEAGECICCFCQKIHLTKKMHTISFIALPGSHFYIPNIYKFKPTKEMVYKDGRIVSCSSCFSKCLQKIWEKPVFPDVDSSIRSNTNDDVIQTCALIKSTDYKDDKTLYKTLYPKYNQVISIPDNSLFPMTSQMPLKRAAICYICGHHCKSAETYAIPDKKIRNDPFFPFLSKYPSPHKESIIDNSNYLVCQFCFHSLIAQWKIFEDQAPDPHLRIYDTHNFVCFVCSTKTYRKRLHVIHVKDYPFLKEHPSPIGGMVINNGNSVVVCKDCSTSLNDQVKKREDNFDEKRGLSPGSQPENLEKSSSSFHQGYEFGRLPSDETVHPAIKCESETNS